VKFKSQLVTQVSGSIGGLTGSHNAAGMYFRARTIPVNPNTAYQQTVRQYMATASQVWSTTLSENTRENWRSYAANTPLTSGMGDPQYISGFSHFVRSYTAALLANVDVVAFFAPGVNLLATGTLPRITVTEGSYQINLTFDNTDDWATVTKGAMLVFAGRPQNIGRNYFSGPYRYCGCVQGDSITPPTPPALLDYPWDGDVDQKIFGYVRFLDGDRKLSSRVPWQTAITPEI
jgi:hypothetical protein